MTFENQPLFDLPADTTYGSGNVVPLEVHQPDRHDEQIMQEDCHIYSSPGQPQLVALELLSRKYVDKEGTATLKYWRGDWWRYAGTHWETISSDILKQEIWRAFRHAKFYSAKDGKLQPWNPTAFKVESVLTPMRMESLVDPRQDAPVWTGEQPAPGERLVSMGNGLFDIDTLQLHPHAPLWFTTWSLPFDYDPHATCSVWSGFLDEVFEHDPAGRDLLQEFMGYLLSGDTRLQKGLLIVGVPRAGKGVLGGVLSTLMGGASNIAAPTLDTLNGDFGLKQLIGKPLAIIGDARNAKRGNSRAVERLLGIIGEDSVTVQRKHQDDWIGHLPTRIVISSNEVPHFVDASGAIGTRFVGFLLPKSFEGREDRQLSAKLNREMPGIFNWALEGLQRLQSNDGVFTVPRTQQDLISSMKAMAAPVTTFLKENYSVTGRKEDVILRKEAYKDFKWWCGDNGYTKVPNANSFDVQVNAAGIEGVRVINMRNAPGAEVARARVITGVRKRHSFSVEKFA